LKPATNNFVGDLVVLTSMLEAAERAAINRSKIDVQVLAFPCSMARFR